MAPSVFFLTAALGRKSCHHVYRFVRTMASMRKGLVLGVYEGDEKSTISMTKACQNFQTNKASKLSELIELSGLPRKKGKCKVFYGLDSDFPAVAVISLGKKDAGYNEFEEVDEGRENVRATVADAVKQLQESGLSSVYIDPCGDAEAAAEGAHLCLWCYDELKNKDKKKEAPELHCFTDNCDDPDSINSAWQRGRVMAEGQNYARRLMESPANVMTPTRFAELAEEYFKGIDNVTVTARDKAWADSMKMGSFTSVSRGSEEPLRFVEVNYKGGKEGDAPFALVGKGITFDSGGISIKPSQSMDEMRADMGGASCAIAAIYAAARLKLPINVMGFFPLCENMPSGTATKPGDVVTAMNGKTIQVDNTDAEGRLVLADALCYAETFKPRGIVDMATLTGAMMVALGSSAAGCFTNSKLLWETMHKAGGRTGDRVWRMPVFKHYSKQINECVLADLNNIGSAGRMGGSCTAAAFLKEFVTNDHWMHMDIAGVMKNGGEVPYLSKGMAGRPTRTIVEFLNLLSKQ